MINHRAVIGFASVGVALVALWPLQLYSPPSLAHEQIRSSSTAQSANRGPFSLVDHRGRAVTDRDFLGKFMLVYFGYTHCEDLCPLDLQVLTRAMEILGTESERVQPIFITVDPERDTVAVMADYVGRFHPRLIGLTGTREQIAAAEKTYRIRRMKFFPSPFGVDGTAEAGITDDNSVYVVDHTASFFLVGPDGAGLMRFNHGITAEEIVADVRRFIGAQPRLGE